MSDEKTETKQADIDQNLLKKNHEFVVPGDKIVESMEYIPGRNCFREGNSIFSKRLGIVHVDNRVLSVVPLSGAYVPQSGDMVIGEIEDVQSSGWQADINSPYSTFLPLSGVKGFVKSGTDLTRIYNIGDLIYAKVLGANRSGVTLSMQDIRNRKLVGGKIMFIDSVKVPRLIGRQGSMISMIKIRTGCSIAVGQNGIVWIYGEKSELVTDVIKLIEKESHTEGLTERVNKFLDKFVPPMQPNQLQNHRDEFAGNGPEPVGGGFQRDEHVQQDNDFSEGNSEGGE